VAQIDRRQRRKTRLNYLAACIALALQVTLAQLIQALL
jgi:hypothetical protein